MAGESIEAEVRMQIRDELQGGVFADFVGVWHNAYGFTLDFAALGVPSQEEGRHVVPAHVVSRVKIPASVIFQVARAIADNVANYETTYGKLPAADDPDTR